MSKQRITMRFHTVGLIAILVFALLVPPIAAEVQQPGSVRQNMSNFLAAVRDIAVIITGIAGLAFGFYRYWKSREGETVLQIEVTLEAHPIASKNLVDICIQIKNMGKAAVYITPAHVKESLCLVRKISLSDKHMQLCFEDLECFDFIDGLEYLSDRDWNEYYPEEPFIFEPNTSETFRVFFSTDYHGPIWIRAMLVDRKDYKWRADRVFVLP